MIDLSQAVWRKSSYSGGEGCVEVASVDQMVGVRDTKDHGNGPTLLFRHDEWVAFIAGVKNNEFNCI
jgi:Domain of unknown function (DUF397)